MISSILAVLFLIRSFRKSNYYAPKVWRMYKAFLGQNQMKAFIKLAVLRRSV